VSVAGRVSSQIETVEIGNSGLRVPRLGVGTVPLGNMLGEMGITVDDEEARRIVQAAHRLGARLLDTAPQYGAGLAEKRLGEALSDMPRDELVISTKVGRLLRTVSTARKVANVLKQSVTGPERGPALIGRHAVRLTRRLIGKDQAYGLGFPFDRGDERALEAYFDFSYDGVLRSHELSLKRLGVDRVEMLYIHDPHRHYDQALTGAFRALDELRSEGSVKAIGVGMDDPAMMARFARDADFDVFLIAGRYTMLNQAALAELLPTAAERGQSVTIGGVFNSGLLADPRPGVAFDYHAVTTSSEPLQRALRMKAVCDRYEVPLAAAAVQFPLAHPAVGTVLVGVRSAAELEENVGHFTRAIPRDLWLEVRAEGLVPDGVPLPGDAATTGAGPGTRPAAATDAVA
jgi:D-threo-aldose 1-dehydrogenase